MASASSTHPQTAPQVFIGFPAPRWRFDAQNNEPLQLQDDFKQSLFFFILFIFCGWGWGSFLICFSSPSTLYKSSENDGDEEEERCLKSPLWSILGCLSNSLCVCVCVCVCVCCLLYTSPSPRDVHKSRMPSSA